MQGGALFHFGSGNAYQTTVGGTIPTGLGSAEVTNRTFASHPESYSVGYGTKTCAVQFGFACTYTYNNPIHNYLDTQSGCYITSRNTFRGAPITKLDLHLQKAISFADKYKLSLIAESFNTLNHSNFGAYNTVVTSSNFGTPASISGNPLAYGPRALQFAARLDFQASTEQGRPADPSRQQQDNPKVTALLALEREVPMKQFRRILRLAFLSLGLSSLIATAQTRTAVILSTDVGNEIDDQGAIAYLLANPAFEVLGNFSAHAPSLPNPTAHRTFLLLQDEIENRLHLRTHPPLLQGADDALLDRHTPRDNAAVRFLIERSRTFDSEHRLTVVTIGAATDVASALLLDPSLAKRIRVVAMAFRSQTNAQEYNVLNDVPAWQVLLDSDVPLVIGSKEVCITDLPIHYDQAKNMLAQDGFAGAWLWEQWNDWYFREVKPLRTNDFSKPRAIWDLITLAYLMGYVTSEAKPRPVIRDDLTMTAAAKEGTVIWVEHVDSERLWRDFQTRLQTFVREHPAVQ